MPDTQKPLIPVGYWCDPDDPKEANLPDPRHSVDPHWDPTERDAVAQYLRQGAEHTAYKGTSWCRFNCGFSEWSMGSRDLTDGVYVWPEGLPHYLEKHQVKPPEEFLAHVREQLRRRAADDRR